MIKVAFEASDPAQLRTILRAFMDAMGEGHAAALHQPSADRVEVEVAQKRGRGRPRKEETGAPTVEQELQDDDIHHTAVTAAAEAEKPKDEPVVSTSVVSDLSADEARNKAIDVMQKHFATHPNAMPEIAKLQAKYGIKKFADIPGDKAHALLADVMLIANGTPGE